MTESILRGLDGEQGVYEAAYVESTVTELPFFASKVKLGPSGVEEVQVGNLQRLFVDESDNQSCGFHEIFETPVGLKFLWVWDAASGLLHGCGEIANIHCY